MLEIYRQIQTYKEEKHKYSKEERKIIREYFRQRIKEISRQSMTV